METEPQFERKSFDSKSRRNLADTSRYLFFLIRSCRIALVLLTQAIRLGYV